ncbi:winged helix-turn-helix transcriptional regulator [Paramixta manurensis]|uniref:winged helix-turn-helix transcriptional regulator n=1 Tax=Paramixta manurensis TaxID=2740817 RepID=UPI00339A94FE
MATARALDVIGDWWSLLIVRDALNGIRRFNEFERSLGLAKNILSSRLKRLVEHGILETVPASDGSAYSEYAPTEKGLKLFPVVIALAQWGTEFLFEPSEPISCPLDVDHHQPLRRIKVQANDGRELGPADIVSITR